jgi:hypothetical protein
MMVVGFVVASAGAAEALRLQTDLSDLVMFLSVYGRWYHVPAVSVICGIAAGCWMLKSELAGQVIVVSVLLTIFTVITYCKGLVLYGIFLTDRKRAV